MKDIPKEGYLWSAESPRAVMLRFLKGRAWNVAETKDLILEALVFRFYVGINSAGILQQESARFDHRSRYPK